MPTSTGPHDDALRDIAIADEAIRVGQLLKLANVVASGGDAKAVLESGGVRVNGTVETRRGRRVRRGDTVTLTNERLRVV